MLRRTWRKEAEDEVDADGGTEGGKGKKKK